MCPPVGRSVSRSVGRSVGPLVMLLLAGRDKPANDLFCVYKLVAREFTNIPELPFFIAIRDLYE